MREERLGVCFELIQLIAKGHLFVAPSRQADHLARGWGAGKAKVTCANVCVAKKQVLNI